MQRLGRLQRGFANLNKAMGTLVDCELLKRMNNANVPGQGTAPSAPPAANPNSSNSAVAPAVTGNP